MTALLSGRGLWLCAALCLVPTQLRAQTLVVQRTAASEPVLASLRSLALESDLRLSVADDPPCDTTTEADAEVHVVLRWHRAAEIEVCLTRGAALHRRSLGPAAALDANAREQIVTLIESGVQTLRADWSLPDAAKLPPTAASDLTTPTASLPAQRHEDREKPAIVSQRADHASGTFVRWSLGAGYGLAWLSSGLAQRLAAVGSASFGPTWALAVALGYVPWNDRTRESVNMSLRVFEARLIWLGSVPIRRDLVLQLGAGPSLEHVTYRANIADGRTARYVDILLNTQLGPRLTVTRAVWMGLWLGADLTVIQRDFEVSQGDNLVTVNRASRVRPRLEIQLGFFL
jgi:hypothetical protein